MGEAKATLTESRAARGRAVLFCRKDAVYVMGHENHAHQVNKWGAQRANLRHQRYEFPPQQIQHDGSDREPQQAAQRQSRQVHQYP